MYSCEQPPHNNDADNVDDRQLVIIKAHFVESNEPKMQPVNVQVNMCVGKSHLRVLSVTIAFLI